MQFSQNALKILEERYLAKNEKKSNKKPTEKTLEATISIIINSTRCLSDDYKANVESQVLDLFSSLIRDFDNETQTVVSKSKDTIHIEINSFPRAINLNKQKAFEDKEKTKFRARLIKIIIPWFKRLLDMLMAEGLKKMISVLIDKLMDLRVSFYKHRIVNI